MKSFIVLAVLIAAALAAPSALTQDGDAEILRYENDNIGVEGYHYGGLGSEYDFVPFGVDTLDPCGPSATRVFKEIAKSIETSNGIQQQEEGRLSDVGTEQEGIVVRGSFSYVGPDGVTYTVNYTADKDGFKPQGAHLPA